MINKCPYFTFIAEPKKGYEHLPRHEFRIYFVDLFVDLLLIGLMIFLLVQMGGPR